MQTKLCSKCQIEKPVSDFYKKERGKYGVAGYCKNCKVKQVKEAHKPVMWFDAHLKRNYGITLQEHTQMFEEQNGVCAICKGEGDGKWKKLCVDHDHKTGNVRQLLCRNCNMVLGQVGDNVELLAEMIKYLNKHNPF
jgi:hypothetical protein